MNNILVCCYKTGQKNIGSGGGGGGGVVVVWWTSKVSGGWPGWEQHMCHRECRAVLCAITQ